MDFYAFLPSNASPDMYPDNKTSHFKIELAQRMELHGHWQVALIELHYPNTIQHVTEGENEIALLSDNAIKKFKVPPARYTNRDDLLDTMNTLFTKDVEKKEGDEICVSVQGSDPVIIKPCTERQRFIGDDHLVLIPPFAMDDATATLSFSPRLALQLGLDSPGPHPANQEIVGKTPINLNLGLPSQLYVYMNILSDQIIGHTRAPLLRSVPVDIGAQYGSMSIFHCDQPIYFDLKTKSFDTLEINIRDHAGRYVSFDYGTLTLLVHFKQL